MSNFAICTTALKDQVVSDPWEPSENGEASIARVNSFDGLQADPEWAAAGEHARREWQGPTVPPTSTSWTPWMPDNRSAGVAARYRAAVPTAADGATETPDADRQQQLPKPRKQPG